MHDQNVPGFPRSLQWEKNTGMRGVGRPLPEVLCLTRPRLLKRLPRSPGYLVLLEAPFGYGKTVLLAQWAEQLGAFRRLWIELYPESDPKAALLEALGLPEGASWKAVLKDLARRPTLVVFDDLEGLEPLGPLLRALPALMGIASRKRLVHPELARLASTGRLLRLGAEELAFTPEEAAALVGDEERGRRLWQETGGWPIALHLAATTGNPDWPSLVAGLRSTLSPELYEELLLLAATGELPREAATPATRRLAELGLLQRAEGGFRIHAALAEALPIEEKRRALLRHKDRVPGLLYGRALERLGLWEELALLLEAPAGEGPLGAPPGDVLRWDRRAPGPRGSHRRMRVAIARLNAGERRAAIEELLALARDPKTPPLVALEAYGVAFFELAGPGLGEIERAFEVLEEAKRLEPYAQEDREFYARYLANVASVYYYAGRLAEALHILSEAQGMLGPENPFFHVLAVNHAALRFELEGDLLGHRQVHERAVRAVLEGQIPPYVLEGSVWADLARDRALLGEREEAHALLEKAPAYLRERLGVLATRVELYRLKEDEAGLREALLEAEILGDEGLTDRARGALAELLAAFGRTEEALRLVEGAKGFWSQRALALLKGDAGLLPRARTREERLALAAGRYRLGEREAIFELVRLTNAGARVLPAFFPLADLPKDHPELAQAYPLRELLASGWKAAIRARLDEVPPLLVRVLGRFAVAGPLGEVVLQGRLRELFALLLLGLDRDALMAAIWPEADRERARNNLYVQLNHLRKLLEPWGVPTYLDEAGLVRVESDLARLIEALEAGDAATAGRLYRAPIFPGVDNPRIDAFREEIRERVRRLLVEKGEERGLFSLFLEDPADPEVARALYRRLLELGREAEAERVAGRFRDAFEAELGEKAPDLGTI